MSCIYKIAGQTFDSENEVKDFIKGINSKEFLSFLSTKNIEKYEEIYSLLQKERGEENVEVITDENGFDWYETKIAPKEKNKPVVAFQKTPTPPKKSISTEGNDIKFQSGTNSLKIAPYEDGYKVKEVIGTKEEVYQDAVKFLVAKGAPLYTDQDFEILQSLAQTNPYQDGMIVAPNRPDFIDKNNEAKMKDVIDYANTTDEKLSKKEIADAMDASVVLGAETSQELYEMLKDPKNFSEYEKLSLSGNFSLLLAKLKNTEFTIPQVDFIKRQEVNGFGKQVPKMIEPTIPIKTVDKDGNIVDKKSDTKEILRLTYPSEPQRNEMPRLATALSKIDEQIFNSNNKLVFEVVEGLKEEALDFGVDLLDIENRLFPKQKLVEFLDALVNYTLNPNEDFADKYDEFFNVDAPKAFKEKFESPYTEYELFDKFSLIKVRDGVYEKVDDTITIEPSAERQAKIAKLEVEDFVVDSNKLERMVYHKEQLGAPLKTDEKIEVEDEINLRKVLKNPYLRVSSQGVTLKSDDALTLAKAELFGYSPQEETKTPKIETDYKLKENLLVTQLSNKPKVRTPFGTYTKITDLKDKSVYTLDGSSAKTVNIAQLVNSTATSPTIEAKKFYTKEEFNNNFGCLN